MHAESCAHIVHYGFQCGKFIDVDCSVVSQADMLILTQNFSSWNTENLAHTKYFHLPCLPTFGKIGLINELYNPTELLVM